MRPFTNQTKLQIGSLGETELIRRLADWLGPANPDGLAGIGDDCASLDPPPPGSQILVTTDPVIYQRHFDDALAPEWVARKLARRNLSDIAAMGGSPSAAFLTLFLPSELRIDWLEKLYRALAQDAQLYRFAISGGDIAQTDRFLALSMTLLGIHQGQPLRRRHAAPDATLWVTGALGGTLAEKHYRFEPRLAEGQWLSRQTDVQGAMDLSDGLGKDLVGFLPADCQAVIDADTLPASKSAHHAASRSGKPALHHVFNDGEDYELLFAVDPQTAPEAFLRRWDDQFDLPASCIGKIVTKPSSDAPAIALESSEEQIDFTGYEHLR